MCVDIAYMELTDKITFGDAIAEFANKKARKIVL